MKLYGYFRSSAAFRVRIALNLKGLSYDQASIHLRRGEQRAADYLALNPQGLVPTLIDDGEAMTQSLAIIEYLDETHPEPPLLPGHPVARARVRSLAQAVACDIHPIDNLRVLRYLAKPLGHDEKTIETWFNHWIMTGFAGIERSLAEDGEAGGGADALQQKFAAGAVHQARLTIAQHKSGTGLEIGGRRLVVRDQDAAAERGSVTGRVDHGGEHAGGAAGAQSREEAEGFRGAIERFHQDIDQASRRWQAQRDGTFPCFRRGGVDDGSGQCRISDIVEQHAVFVPQHPLWHHHHPIDGEHGGHVSTNPIAKALGYRVNKVRGMCCCQRLDQYLEFATTAHLQQYIET